MQAKLKHASNQLLALKNEVNEKELALLENDAAFAKQLFHMKKLLGEREKVRELVLAVGAPRNSTHRVHHQPERVISTNTATTLRQIMRVSVRVGVWCRRSLLPNGRKLFK